ncbi:hypothetical protein [Mucilaginibacter sp. UR6-11]|uniref:hypothetical protein n=1 Tax=Mucilaginibacter sp. UR6-11 TaxID=1435644 RepID=UPI001E2A0586|nr:hypothetical protein [Mucilaginibacter sp. UR6-11]MCC8427245.1 hypothetical protein [Mucilaginibacter sp. UR6-11]
MAGNKLTYHKSIKASTILEVIISMIIILLVFTIAMMISANVMRSSLSVKKVAAQAVLHEILIKVEQVKEPASQIYTVDEFRIEQEIKPDANFQNLLDVHLTAYDTNQEKLAELQKIIINKNE